MSNWLFSRDRPIGRDACSDKGEQFAAAFTLLSVELLAQPFYGWVRSSY